MGEQADVLTKLMGSTNISVPFNKAGISSVQFLWDHGMTSTGAHLVTYTAPPALIAMCPLPNMAIKLYGLSAPTTASNLVWAIPFLYTLIALLTCLNFSFMSLTF